MIQNNISHTHSPSGLALLLLGLLPLSISQSFATELTAGSSAKHPELYNVDYAYSKNNSGTEQKSLSIGWISNPFQFASPLPWEKENQYSYSIDVDVFSGKTSERSFDGVRAFAAFWQKLNPQVFFQLGFGLHSLRRVDSTPVIGGQIGYKPHDRWRLMGRLSDDFAYPVGFQPGATRSSLRRTVYEITSAYRPSDTIKVPARLKHSLMSDTNNLSNVQVGVMTALAQSENEVWLGVKYFYEGSKISSKTTDLGYFAPVKWVRWSLEAETAFRLSKNWTADLSLSLGKVSQLTDPSSNDLGVDALFSYGQLSRQQISLGLNHRSCKRDSTPYNETKAQVSWVRRF